MSEIRGFRDLHVYQKARGAAREGFAASRRYPREETYSLTDRIRRASRAVNAMVAEAWARRRYEAAFINKLNEALGEAMETQAWLDHALDCEYLTVGQHAQMDAAWQEVGAMLNGMIAKSASFCPQTP